MIHLVAHDKVGAGYALQESDGRWIVRFHHNWNKYFTFTKDAFNKGYLKDCGIVKIEDVHEQELSNHSKNRRTTSH